MEVADARGFARSKVEKDITYRDVQVHYWLAAKVIYPSQADSDGVG